MASVIRDSPSFSPQVKCTTQGDISIYSLYEAPWFGVIANMVIGDQDNSPECAEGMLQPSVRATPAGHRPPWFRAGMLDMALDSGTAAMAGRAFDWPGQIPRTNLSGKGGRASEHPGASRRRSRLKGWRFPHSRKGSSKGPKGQSILCTPDWEAQPGTSPACDSILPNKRTTTS